MNVLFCSCVILINKNNEILICQRPKGKFMDGFWEFPGGKVKNSEKFNYAAIVFCLSSCSSNSPKFEIKGSKTGEIILVQNSIVL